MDPLPCSWHGASCPSLELELELKRRQIKSAHDDDENAALMYAREAKIGNLCTVESQQREGSEREKGRKKEERGAGSLNLAGE